MTSTQGLGRVCRSGGLGAGLGGGGGGRGKGAELAEAWSGQLLLVKWEKAATRSLLGKGPRKVLDQAGWVLGPQARLRSTSGINFKGSPNWAGDGRFRSDLAETSGSKRSGRRGWDQVLSLEAACYQKNRIERER